MDRLVDALRRHNQASVVLIAWHHGRIGDLLGAFGAGALLGRDKWPADVYDWLVYDWLVVLHFDDRGRLIPARSQRVREHLLPGD